MITPAALKVKNKFSSGNLTGSKPSLRKKSMRRSARINGVSIALERGISFLTVVLKEPA